MFHGINVPIPCNNNIKKIILNLSLGGFISSVARSIVMPVGISDQLENELKFRNINSANDVNALNDNVRQIKMINQIKLTSKIQFIIW